MPSLLRPDSIVADDYHDVHAPSLDETVREIAAEVLRRDVSEVDMDQTLIDQGAMGMALFTFRQRLANALGMSHLRTEAIVGTTLEGLIEQLQHPQADDHEEEPALVTLRSTGTKMPLYCVHGVGGEALSFAPFVAAMGQEQPFFGLQTPRLEGKQHQFPSVRDMAARYVAEIRERDEGPYALAGYSFGGPVAHEMACQLAEEGQRVGFLGLIEPYRDSREWSARAMIRCAQNLPLWVKDECSEAGGTVPFLKQTGGKMWSRIRSRFGHSGSENHAPAVFGRFPDSLSDIVAHHARILGDHSPSFFPGLVTQFRARVQPLLQLQASYWSKFAADVEEVKVTGNHSTIMKGDNAHALAKEVKSRIPRR